MASREIRPVGVGCKRLRELKHNASIESPTPRTGHATVGDVTEEPEVPVPKHWHVVAKSGLVHAVALARVALLQILSGFENGRNPRARMLSEVERLRQRVHQLETELAIKDRRMAKLAPAKRPHYSAPDRLQILLLQAVTGWSLEETARRFFITTRTIAGWKHKLDDLGEAALVRLAQPVNRFPDQVRQLVRDLKQLYPSMGRQRIADTLARTGLVLAASTVRRMVLEQPGEPGEGPATGPDSAPSQPDVDPHGSTAAPPPAEPKGVTARYTHHVWHCDLTLVPTAAGLWVPWFPFAAWLGWPFAYWVVGVVDQFSRAPIKLKAFKKHPSGREVRRFLRSSIQIAGRAPQHLITDRGVQFRAEYRVWCERLDVKPRWGAVGSHRSIAVIERFWRSLKAECCRTILIPFRLSAFQADLDCYAAWFRTHRPHQALGGRTPEEYAAETQCSVPRLEPLPNMSIRGDPDSVRHVSSVELRVSPFAGKKHLPVVEVEAA